MKTKNLAYIGMFGALSAILMLLEIPIPFAPTFLKLDFSELPVILGGFMMGPIAGTLIAVIKIGLNFVLNGTETMGVGELSNFIGSVCYMLPAVLIYKKAHTKKGAEISLTAGTVIVSVCMILSNMLFVFPLYGKLFGMDMDAILAMGSATNPLVKNWFTMIVFALLPFNLFKYGLTSVLVFLLYKKLKRVMHM